MEDIKMVKGVHTADVDPRFYEQFKAAGWTDAEKPKTEKPVKKD